MATSPERIQEILSQTHTRKLMQWLEKARKCGGGWSPWDNKMDVITFEDIKAELAKRPHIPNKKESKALRIKRIKEGV
jgi:hypothetical protein